MCTRKAAVAFFKTEYIIVSMILLKELDLLSDILKSGPFLPLVAI